MRLVRKIYYLYIYYLFLGQNQIMDIIESVTGKLNLNLGNMNNPNIIIEGIKIDNSDSDDDEEEEEEEDEEEEEEEEDDDEEENENTNENNGINDENNDEEDEEEDEEENEEEENNELEIFNQKKKKLILNLNEFQFKHIKKYSQIKEKKCPICLLKYRGSDIIKEFPCNHIYHKDCILKWLKKSNICPLCKYDITGDVNDIELKKMNGDDYDNDDDEEEEENDEEKEDE